MKNIATALFLAATVLTAASALAQDPQVKATVPFAFTVGRSTLPAGAYTIGSRMNSPYLLSVSNVTKSVNIFAVGQSGEANAALPSVLIFHKYGSQYFLSDVRSGVDSMNIHFTPTKAEKKVRAQTEEAGLFRDDPVMIALNR